MGMATNESNVNAITNTIKSTNNLSNTPLNVCNKLLNSATQPLGNINGINLV
jgi:hypothetical protein